jgi:hypothetical protein
LDQSLEGGFWTMSPSEQTRWHAVEPTQEIYYYVTS